MMKCLVNKEVESTVLKIITCKSVAGHNACGHELSEIMAQFEWLKLEFPFNKQFIFIPEISTITHRDNPHKFDDDSFKQQMPSIEIGYTMLDGSKKSIELNSIRQIRRVDILKQLQSNNSNASKPQESSQQDSQSFSQQQQQQKQQVPSPQTAAVMSQQQSLQSMNPGNRAMHGGGIVVSDGLYFLGDFVKEECSKGSAQDLENQLMESYMERLLESFNKDLILQFIHYYLTSSLLSLLKNNRPVDVGVSNFLLLRQGNNVRFIFLLSVEAFALQFEENFEEFNRNRQQPLQQGQFNYALFKENFIASRVDRLGELNEKMVEILLSTKERNEYFSEEHLPKKFISQIFEKRQQKLSISNSICVLEQRKRYNSFFLPHNTVLNYIFSNPGVLKEVQELILQEKQSAAVNSSAMDAGESNHQLALVNELLKYVLTKENNRARNFIGSDKPPLYTEVVFSCEETSITSQEIQSKSSAATSMAAGTKAPFTPSASMITSATTLEQQNQQARTSQSLQSYSNNAHSLPLQWDEVKKLNLTFFVAERASSRRIQQQQSEQKQSQSQPSQQQQMSQQAPPPPPGENEKFSFRTVEKRITIDMSEETKKCFMKLSIWQANSQESNEKFEMNMTSDLIDEVYYVLQILNSAFSDFSIKIDEMKKMGFHMNFNLNKKIPLLTRVIHAIDILVIAGLVFHDFFYQHITNSKSTRDSSKYKLIQYELEHALLAYKLRFARFEAQMSSALQPRNQQSHNFS